jgi:SAM-dependent methyltransferase
LEHIEDEIEVLRNFHEVLAPGGRVVVLVPNNPAMYAGVDKALGHYRRYTAEELRSKMEKAGFRVLSCEGFNRVGGFGWRVSGKILRKKTLSIGQIRLFELAMPVIRLLEKVPFHCHNSLICVGEKAAERKD